MSSVTEYLIKLGYAADTRGAEKFSSSITEINQGLEVLQKVLGLAQRGAAAMFQTLGRGDQVLNLGRAFENLRSETGAYEVSLRSLKAATGEALSNTELMQKANRALGLGMPVDQVNDMFAATKQLSDSLGKDLKTSIDGVIAGLTGGSQRALKGFGIFVKEGESAAAVVGRLKERAEALASGSETAAGAASRLKSSWEDAKDEFAAAFSQSDILRITLLELTTTMQNVDWAQFAEDAARTGAALIHLTDNLIGFLEALGMLEEKNPALQDFSDHIDELSTQGADGIKQLTLEYGQLAEKLHNLDVERRALQKQNDQTLFTPSNIGQLKAISKQLDDNAKEAAFLQKEFDLVGQRLHTLGRTGKNSFERELTPAMIQAQKEAEKLKKSFDDFVGNSLDSLKMQDLGRTLTTSIEKLSSSDFESALSNYETALRETTYNSIKRQFGELADSEAAAEVLDGLTGQDAQQKIDDFAKKLSETSVSFFQDAFYDLFTGNTFDLELFGKKIASGIAAGIAGNLFPGMGQFGNPQGLGQSLGTSIFQSLIGQGAKTAFGSVADSIGLGSLFGGAAIAESAVPAGYGATAAALPELFGGAAASGAGMTEGITAALAGIGPAGWAAIAGAAVVGGLSASGAFGSKKGADQKQRDAIKDALRETGLGPNLSFQGAGGRPISFNYGADGTSLQYLDPSNPLSGRAAGLTRGLAGATAGFGTARGQDFTNIFANAVLGDNLREATNEATSFNEVLVNTLTLYEQMGISAQDVKDQSVAAFLDSKLSLSEFGEVVSNQNMLLQHNLEGVGNVSDALLLLAKNAEQPRIQMKAIEFLFSEFEEIGVSGTRNVGNALEQYIGNEGKAAFDQLAAAGFDTWDKIQNGGADAIYLLFSVLAPLQNRLENLFGVVRDDGSDAFNALANNSTKAAETINRNFTTSKRAAEQFTSYIQASTKAQSDFNSAGSGVRNSSGALNTKAL